MPERKYRYRVLSAWGSAPQEVKDMVGKAQAYLVYPTYLGYEKDETLVNLATGKPTGGWYMELREVSLDQRSGLS